MFSPFHAKNSQNIDHKEDTKEWEVFLNTEVEEVQSTLQFSTSVELRPGNVISSVSITQKLQRTALRILLIFGQKLDIDILRKITKPFFR